MYLKVTGSDRQFESSSIAFNNLVRALINKSERKKVVVLIDEYDSPITEYLGDEEKLQQRLAELWTFFKMLKATTEIQLCIVTGANKIATSGLFSGKLFQTILFIFIRRKPF
jgi:hypothetical protein